MQSRKATDLSNKVDKQRYRAAASKLPSKVVGSPRGDKDPPRTTAKNTQIRQEKFQVAGSLRKAAKPSKAANTPRKTPRKDAKQRSRATGTEPQI